MKILTEESLLKDCKEDKIFKGYNSEFDRIIIDSFEGNVPKYYAKHDMEVLVGIMDQLDKKLEVWLTDDWNDALYIKEFKEWRPAVEEAGRLAKALKDGPLFAEEYCEKHGYKSAMV